MRITICGYRKATPPSAGDVYKRQCLDRRKLGAAVFGDETARLRLNGILHPAIRAGMLKAAEAAEESGFRVIVFDVPLLIECGWQEIADEVWPVSYTHLLT